MSGAAQLAAVLADFAHYALVALVLAWVLISWFPAYPSNPILQKLYDVVGRAAGPIMRPLRRLIPTVDLGGFALDLSPILVLLALSGARGLFLALISRLSTASRAPGPA